MAVSRTSSGRYHGKMNLRTVKWTGEMERKELEGIGDR